MLVAAIYAAAYARHAMPAMIRCERRFHEVTPASRLLPLCALIDLRYADCCRRR